MTHERDDSTKSRADVWSWGELFTLRVPSSLAVTDTGTAVEFVAADPDTGEPDEREGSRAWLSVFGEDPDPGRASAALPGGPPTGLAAAPPSPVTALARFAASHGVHLPPDAIHLVEDRGVTWARTDFDAGSERWQAIALAWNTHLALFLVAATPGDDAFLGAMDQLLASWQPLSPVIALASPRETDDGF